jgi:ribonuclease BN (tRNA processing enzyme)
MANLQAHIGLDQVTAIVLSHEHPDHTGDLAGYFVASKYYIGLSNVPVYAPASVRHRVYYSGRPIEWCTISNGSRQEIGDLVFTFSRTEHGPETLAMRIDSDGRSLGYSADSGPAWRLSDLGPGIDLALCEATYLHQDEGTADHMSARQAGQSARDAGVGRLVLTHLQPRIDPAEARVEAEGAFGRPVEVAAEHEVYTV